MWATLVLATLLIDGAGVGALLGAWIVAKTTPERADDVRRVRFLALGLFCSALIPAVFALLTVTHLIEWTIP